MPGTEAILVLGVISSIIAIVDATKEVYDAAASTEGLPEAFREVAGRLPIVRNILDLAKQCIDKGDVDEDSCKGVKHVVESCENKAKKLDELFHKVVPANGASDLKRYYKAVKAYRKGNEVKNLMKGMLEDVQLLGCEHGMKTATKAQQEQIAKAIIELFAILPSVPKHIFQETGFTASNSGSSTQSNFHAQGEYIALGDARQYNSGGGAMSFAQVNLYAKTQHVSGLHNPYENTTGFIVCIDDCAKTFEDCLSRHAIDSLADGGWKGLSGSPSLASKLIDGIPTQHFGLLPSPNYGAKPSLYLYCSPCHLVLDLALSICGHLTYFKGVIRVDNRLCAPSVPRRTVFQGMSTLQQALVAYEHEWRVESRYEHSWLSNSFDLSWLQQRENDLGLELEEPPTTSAPAFGLDKYFPLHKDDAKCAAIVVMTGSLCSGKLLSQPMVSPPAKEPRNGEIFRLAKTSGLSNGLRTNWNGTFFGRV